MREVYGWLGNHFKARKYGKGKERNRSRLKKALRFIRRRLPFQRPIIINPNAKMNGIVHVFTDASG